MIKFILMLALVVGCEESPTHFRDCSGQEEQLAAAIQKCAGEPSSDSAYRYNLNSCTEHLTIVHCPYKAFSDTGKTQQRPNKQPKKKGSWQ